MFFNENKKEPFIPYDFEVNDNVAFVTYNMKDLLFFFQNRDFEKEIEKLRRRRQTEYLASNKDKSRGFNSHNNLKEFFEDIFVLRNRKENKNFIKLEKGLKKTKMIKSFVGSIPNVEHTIQGKPKDMFNLKRQHSRKEINLFIQYSCRYSPNDVMKMGYNFLKQNNKTKDIKLFFIAKFEKQEQNFYLITEVVTDRISSQFLTKSLIYSDLLRRIDFLLFENLEFLFSNNNYGLAVFKEEIEKIIKNNKIFNNKKYLKQNELMTLTSFLS